MIALDTNVLLYACDRADSKRQQIAIDLIANSRDGVLLWQVACEFVAASRRFGVRLPLKSLRTRAAAATPRLVSARLPSHPQAEDS
jgi:predicted nucleic acid-binding protein